jgi:hypothetical protein
MVFERHRFSSNLAPTAGVVSEAVMLAHEIVNAEMQCHGPACAFPDSCCSQVLYDQTALIPTARLEMRDYCNKRQQQRRYWKRHCHESFV